jgi:hypothetical protein
MDKESVSAIAAILLWVLIGSLCPLLGISPILGTFIVLITYAVIGSILYLGNK